MTAAQQKSRERFKKAIAEAKKLRKKNPKLSQAQAVKQAWAILYSSGTVSGVKKKAAKKAAAKKKTAVKKKAAVKKSSYHKDNKSHNVNIRVISGVPTSLDMVASKKNLQVVEVKYNFQGLKKYKGYILIDNERNEIVEIEPWKSSQYNWKVILRLGEYNNDIFYCKNLSEVVKKINLSNIKPGKTGYKYTGPIK